MALHLHRRQTAIVDQTGSACIHERWVSLSPKSPPRPRPPPWSSMSWRMCGEIFPNLGPPRTSIVRMRSSPEACPDIECHLSLLALRSVFHAYTESPRDQASYHQHRTIERTAHHGRRQTANHGPSPPTSRPAKRPTTRRGNTSTPLVPSQHTSLPN